MKFQKMISLAAALALFPFIGRPAVDVSATVGTPPAAVVPLNAARELSPQAHEVVKLVSSGVPNDVIKAYIDSSPSTFNLTSDNIVHLQQLGVSGALLTEMLDHDRALRQMAAATPPPQAYEPGQTYQQPSAPYPDQTQGTADTSSPGDTDYYNQLSPYGNFNYIPDYGWGWQPYSGLSYSAYPWPVLGWGFWWNCPGFGWCWFPRGGFHNGFHGGFHAGFHSGFHAGFHAGSGFRPGFKSGGFGRPSFTGGFHGGTMGGFHGNVSGFHGNMGGFHGGSMGGFHGGSMGGFHGGGGGGHGGGGGGGHR